MEGIQSVIINGDNNKCNVTVNIVSVNKKPKNRKRKNSFWKKLCKLIHSAVVVIVSFLKTLTTIIG